MLLPSVLPCDSGIGQTKPQRLIRPKLPYCERFNPGQHSQSTVVGLIASCRALQNMLGERFSPALLSPGIIVHNDPLRSFLSDCASPTVHPPASRGANKRTRDDFEDEQVGCFRQHSAPKEAHVDMYSTPKRRRVVPLELPPGLLASDFEALARSDSQLHQTQKNKHRVEGIVMPKGEETPPSSESESECQLQCSWTESDDHLLVETVLAKLKLSSREWNDCAMRLGKDKDSLGRRWRLLVGEGNIGLRRGLGRMGRVDLDIPSWS